VSSVADGAGALGAPRTAAGQAGLNALVADPAGALLAFDFDGTLAPIVPDPDQARAHPQATDQLARLAAHVRRVAVITGRPARLVVDRAGFAKVPGLESLLVLGHYGLERWDAATHTLSSPEAHQGVELVRRDLPGVVAASVDDPGIWIEDKGHAVAVHTRRAQAPQEAFDRLVAPLAVLAARASVVVEPGRLVLELRPAGMDKGAALRALVAEVRPTSVTFVGDDLGDLAAFDAVEALRAEGMPGLLVCSGSEEVVAVAARADLVVDGPDGVVALLAGLVDRLAAQPG
jgi:trehalose 6-phosphate phosphatase